MNRNCFGLLVTAGLLLATGNASAVTVPGRLNMLYSFCSSNQCTSDQRALGTSPGAVVAGPNGAYYGVNTRSALDVDGDGISDSSGAIYRLDPVTRDVSLFYPFPTGIEPAPWLMVDPDGNLYGGYFNSGGRPGGKAEGHYRISPSGEFTIVYETDIDNFAVNAPVRDSTGNLVGVAGSTPSFVYKIGPMGDFRIVHALPDPSESPFREPVLAADGSLYGISGLYVYRVAPDETFTIVRKLGDGAVQYPFTALNVGQDGALYGALRYSNGGGDNTDSTAIYRLSLDGEFTILSTQSYERNVRLFGNKWTLMPDGNFYGLLHYYGEAGTDGDALFRVSADGTYTQLRKFAYETQGGKGYAPLARGFDDALYGTQYQSGVNGGGTLFRFVPPPAN